METSVTDAGIPNIESRKSRLALAHNFAASLLLPLVPAPPDDADDDAFPNEKDGVADVEAGAGDELKLCPNESGADGAAAVVDGAAGAAVLPPKENPVTPDAAGAGADVVVGLAPNEKEGADVPLVKSNFAKGFAFAGASPAPLA
jgi:hypothetical protein